MYLELPNCNYNWIHRTEQDLCFLHVVNWAIFFWCNSVLFFFFSFLFLGKTVPPRYAITWACITYYLTMRFTIIINNVYLNVPRWVARVCRVNWEIYFFFLCWIARAYSSCELFRNVRKFMHKSTSTYRR